MFCNQMRFKALSSLQTVKRVGVPSPLLLLRLMLDILASSDSTKNGPKVWVLEPRSRLQGVWGHRCGTVFGPMWLRSWWWCLGPGVGANDAGDEADGGGGVINPRQAEGWTDLVIRSFYLECWNLVCLSKWIVWRGHGKSPEWSKLPHLESSFFRGSDVLWKVEAYRVSLAEKCKILVCSTPFALGTPIALWGDDWDG